jgi:hypothetical protein
MIRDNGNIRLANKALQALIAVFSFSGVLASTLRCPLPTPWFATDAESCPNAAPIYLYVNINSAITDVLLCALAITMVWNVKTTRRKKALIMAMFGFRIM